MKQHLLISVAALLALSAKAEQVKMSPEDLLSRLHDANQEEISVGQIAKEKAQSEKVKKFGEKLVRDHEKADKEVTDLAKQKNIDLESAVPKSTGEASLRASQTAEMGELKMLSGAHFDQKFVESMKTDHDDLIHLLETASVDDAQVQKLIKKILPQLKEHRMMAKNLEQK